MFTFLYIFAWVFLFYVTASIIRASAPTLPGPDLSKVKFFDLSWTDQ